MVRTGLVSLAWQRFDLVFDSIVINLIYYFLIARIFYGVTTNKLYSVSGVAARGARE